LKSIHSKGSEKNSFETLELNVGYLYC
jgi:hypothetical protein